MRSAADELRFIRVDVLDYTQRRMAQALRLWLRTYQRYESGEVRRVPSTVLDHARALSARATPKSA